ncbi:MAG TPA: SHOCT domain-containing protein [Kineosporiaceae bacterium]|nr:SHOCT domain-containing protein [Kineosporiaceae bacterium]
MGVDASMGGAAWLLNGVILIAMWALLVGAVILALRAWRAGGGDTDGRADGHADGREDGREDGAAEPGAEQLLAERFARGEIDAEEYLRRREVLQSRD